MVLMSLTCLYWQGEIPVTFWQGSAQISQRAEQSPHPPHPAEDKKVIGLEDMIRGLSSRLLAKNTVQNLLQHFHGTVAAAELHPPPKEGRKEGTLPLHLSLMV